MSLRIGRVALGDSAGITDMRWRGSNLRMAVEVFCSTASELATIRRQLLAYEGNDGESVIPVVWDDVDGDDTVTGYYRVGGVDATANTGTYAGNVLEVSLDFDRVGGAEMLFESHYTGDLRTNTNSITAGTELHHVSFPPGAVVDTAGVASVSSSGRVSFEGLPRTLRSVTDADVPGARFRWSSLPADFMAGAAKIEMRDKVGDPWRTVVGKRDRVAMDASSLGQVRISNGMVAFTIGGDTAYVPIVSEVVDQASPWEWLDGDGEAWVTLDGDSLATQTASITANSADRVTVAIVCTCTASAGGNMAATLYLTLTRGRQWILGYLAAAGAPVDPFAVLIDNTGTAITGGIDGDASGGSAPVVIGSSDATFNDAGAQAIATAGASDATWSFMVGVEALNGGVSAQNQVYEYHATTTEAVQVTAP